MSGDGRSRIPANRQKRSRSLVAFILFSFILLFSLLSVGSFRRKSPTYDETIHLFAGYSYVRWGDFRVNPEHPPLAKVLAALPLLALNLKDPRPLSPYWDLIPQERDYGWLLAHQMVFLDNDAETLFFYAKIPLLVLSVLLGLFVHRWAREFYGIEAGIASALIYFLDPNILAHSHIIHTDIPFTAFFFIGSYFYCRALAQLNWYHVLLTSIFFGLAAITKFSFWMILPIWVALGLLRILSPEPMRCDIWGPRGVSDRWGKAAWVGAALLAALIAGYISIWTAYGFRFSALASGDTGQLPIAQLLPEAPGLPSFVIFAVRKELFPEGWVSGLLYVARHMKRPAYLFGGVSEDGFWSYFPVAFLVKTPLPTLLLLFLTAVLWITRRRVRTEEWFLLIPIVLYFGFAVWYRLNIGLRHIFPVYPFLFVLVSGTVGWLWSSGKWRYKCSALILGLWYLWTSAHIYPHYLAFFNGLIVGPHNAYEVLTDSSLDWGQDLKGLKRWMEENGVKKIQLAYFGTADPSYYGIDAVYLPGSVIFSPRPASANPETPGYLAVSATYIYGVHSGKPLQGRYLSLREKQPVATIGYSLFVYKLD